MKISMTKARKVGGPDSTSGVTLVQRGRENYVKNRPKSSPSLFIDVGHAEDIGESVKASPVSSPSLFAKNHRRTSSGETAPTSDEDDSNDDDGEKKEHEAMIILGKDFSVEIDDVSSEVTELHKNNTRGNLSQLDEKENGESLIQKIGLSEDKLLKLIKGRSPMKMLLGVTSLAPVPSPSSRERFQRDFAASPRQDSSRKIRRGPPSPLASSENVSQLNLRHAHHSGGDNHINDSIMEKNKKDRRRPRGVSCNKFQRIHKERNPDNGIRDVPPSPSTLLKNLETDPVVCDNLDEFDFPILILNPIDSAIGFKPLIPCVASGTISSHIVKESLAKQWRLQRKMGIPSYGVTSGKDEHLCVILRGPAPPTHNSPSSLLESIVEETENGDLEVVNTPSSFSDDSSNPEDEQVRERWGVCVHKTVLSSGNGRLLKTDDYPPFCGEDIRGLHGVLSMYLEDGRFEEASALLADELIPKLQYRHKSLNQNKPGSESDNWQDTYGATLRNLGVIELFAGNPPLAADAFLSAVKNDTNDVIPLSYLGISMFSMEKFDEANRMFLSAVLMLERWRTRCRRQQHIKRQKHYHYHHRRRHHIKHNNQPKSPEDTKQSRFGADNFALGTLLNNVGCTFYQRNELETAKMWFVQALHVFHEGLSVEEVKEEGRGSRKFVAATACGNDCNVGVFPKCSFDGAPLSFKMHTASTYCNLAKVLARRREYKNAAVVLEQAVKLHKEIPGIDHSTVISSMNSLAHVNTRLGKYLLALRTLENMLEIMPNNNNPPKRTTTTQDQQQPSSDPSDDDKEEEEEDDIVKILGKMRLVHLSRQDSRSAVICLKRILAHQSVVVVREEEEEEEEKKKGVDDLQSASF